MKFITTIFLCASVIFSQEFNYVTDSLAVRAILDSNRLSNITIAEVATLNDDRITALNFTKRGITVLPPEIQELSELTILNFKENNLDFLPLEVFNLNKLVALYLGTNRLENLSNEIGNLTNLTILHLSKNKLSTLPDSIVKLQNLTDLRLQHNSLQLSGELKTWADQYDPDWKAMQDPVSILLSAAVKKRLELKIFTTTSKSIGIHYFVPESGITKLIAYDYKGQVAKIILNGYKQKGNHIITWHPNLGATGICFVQLLAGTYMKTKNITLLR